MTGITDEGAFVPVRCGAGNDRCEVVKLAFIQLDRVVALPEIGDRVCTKVVAEHECVGAPPAREDISRSADENIFTIAAANLLEPEAPVDDLLAIPTCHDAEMIGVDTRLSTNVSLTWLDHSHRQRGLRAQMVGVRCRVGECILSKRVIGKIDLLVCLVGKVSVAAHKERTISAFLDKLTRTISCRSRHPRHSQYFMVWIGIVCQNIA